MPIKKLDIIAVFQLFFFDNFAVLLYAAKIC